MKLKIASSMHGQNMILVLVLFHQLVHSLHIPDSGHHQHKRRYFSDSGFKKVKRYLSRKYMQSRNNTLDKNYFSNSWAVHIDPPDSLVADRIAKKHGFINVGEIGNEEGHYHFKHVAIAEKGEKRALHKTKSLSDEKEVKAAIQQKILERVKRDFIPNDPYFKDMWYLLNTGQASGPAGVDMNVLPVWNRNITGRNVVISVLDDGMDHTHPDLEKNYDPIASSDLNDNDDDPMPRDSDPDNCHGTRCAGEAAASANNGICGIGVAYDAKIGAVRMLDGQATDILEGTALAFKKDHIDIYINCWGPKDDGKTFGKPGPEAGKALRKAAVEGRRGLGSIFVWATGNGGLTDDDCNCDGYTTSIFTISIGCIGDHGLSAYYTEKCSSTLAVTFNGASHREGRENKMVTTDLYHQCTEEFKGTSASAPLAAGIIALTLQANPNLTWRDVQAIIVTTAQMTSPVDDGWKRNGAGFHFNHKFGFGRMDAEAMVNAAINWSNLPPQKMCVAYSSSDRTDIPRNDVLTIDMATSACESTRNQITKLEHVVLTISFVHRRRGDVSIDLISPSGTLSQMLSTRKYDDSDEGLDEWNFMTVYKWGEQPKGLWKIRVADNPSMEACSSTCGIEIEKCVCGEANDDIEVLEEQVIDQQAKLKKPGNAKIVAKNPNYDFPYPAGVRKNKVETGKINTPQNIKQPFDGIDRVEYDRSAIPPETQQPVEYENEHVVNSYNDEEIPRSTIPEAHYNEYTVPVKKGKLAVFDEKADNTKTEDGELSGENDEHFAQGELDGDSERENVREKKNIFDDEKQAIYQFYNNIKKKQPFRFKKVQVQEEETGTQRVQVNAGYENPQIECVSGKSCSGVLLKWVLTLYGTGE